MDRRAFFGVVLGVVASPRASQAQRTGKVFRIGFLHMAGGPLPAQQGLLEGLQNYGLVEGRNFTMERRYANFDPSALRVFAAELVALPVDVIVAAPIVAAFAAKEATKNIPIVVVAAHDAAGTGLVASLARPGGNVTGIDSLAPGLDAKRLDLVKQVIPGLARVAVLYNPADPAARLHLDAIDSAADALRLKVQVFEVRQAAEIESVFHTLAEQRPDALITGFDPLVFFQRERIVALAAQHRMPVVSEFHEFAEVGALLVYGPDLRAIYRRAGYYVDRILKGAKPADLPMEQPTEFTLIVNLRTAKALDLSIPQSLLMRANEVIQ